MIFLIVQMAAAKLLPLPLALALALALGLALGLGGGGYRCILTRARQSETSAITPAVQRVNVAQTEHQTRCDWSGPDFSRHRFFFFFFVNCTRCKSFECTLGRIDRSRFFC